MSRTVRGKRDGSGPFKGSFRSRTSSVGRRRAAGVRCPVRGRITRKKK